MRQQQGKKDWTFGGDRERDGNTVIMAVWIVQDSRIDFHFQTMVCYAEFLVGEVRMRHLGGCTVLTLITCEVRQDCYVCRVGELQSALSVL